MWGVYSVHMHFVCLFYWFNNISCECAQVHMSPTLSPSSDFVPLHCLWVCVTGLDSQQGTGFGLRVSQPAASLQGKGGWWITILWGKATPPPPANTPCWPACRENSQSCSQQEAWKHNARARAKNHIQYFSEPGSVCLWLWCWAAGCTDQKLQNVRLHFIWSCA